MRLAARISSPMPATIWSMPVCEDCSGRMAHFVGHVCRPDGRVVGMLTPVPARIAGPLLEACAVTAWCMMRRPAGISPR